MQELIDAIQKNDPVTVAALLDSDRTLLRAKAGNTSALLLALYHGRPEIARLFVDRGAEVSFAEACALGDAARVEAMMQKDSSLANSFSDDGFPALGLAVYFRQRAIARALIGRGADVNAAARNPQKVAPIHGAASIGDREMVRLLLDHGANPNAKQDHGFMALQTAAAHGDIEMAAMLLEHGADPRAASDDGKTAEDMANEKGQTKFVEWLRLQY